MIQIYNQPPTRLTTARVWMVRLQFSRADAAHAQSQCPGQCIARRPTHAPIIVHA